MQLSYCSYRLLFKHPFGTSHGVRTGTDSIFIRLEENGLTGYGEVTLPPYLKEKPHAVIERLNVIVRNGPVTAEGMQALLGDDAFFKHQGQGCRAGLQMAWCDWLAKKNNCTVYQRIGDDSINKNITLVTIGLSEELEIKTKLSELPQSGAIKVKVEDELSAKIVLKVKELDTRPIFIDANQGLKSVAAARALADVAGRRLLGLEQPFPVEESALAKDLQAQLSVPVFGDESIQDFVELKLAVGIYNGVNIKLMKCGGLDRAEVMAKEAKKLGMQVMLGSMSESSLGCTAMAHLAGLANIVDLDGPWLIKNDPFRGISMQDGKLIMPQGPGIGAVLVDDLEFTSIFT